MITFVKGLFIDLRNRIDKANSELAHLNVISDVAKGFKNKTIESLQGLGKRMDSVIASGILDNDAFTSNVIIKFNSMSYEFIEIELFRYHAIRRYDIHADGHFEKVITKIYDEIQCLQSIPFLSTISNSDTYYWAYPKYNMIALPQGEEKNLLNLSDLYHEIGHLIFQQSRSYLIGKFLPSMQKYYELEKQRLIDEGNASFGNEIDDAVSCWNGSWAEEFTCDLIGTFLVGPAYAWTNLKMSTVSSSYNAVYSDNMLYREHPPDEARMRAVFKMMEQTGFGTELVQIKDVWDKFLTETQNSKPGVYDFIFPDQIIESLSKSVYDGCVSIGLRPYSEQMLIAGHFISKIINESWVKIRQDPTSFNAWEARELLQLV